MNEINYQNKVALNENPEIADINKVKADDMNEIKSVVNTNSRTSSNNFGLGTDTWTSSGTYAIGDIVVYNDNTYKNLTGTNTTTTPDQDSTNWEVMPLIVDEYNTSTKNAYACDYVNDLVEDVYSTDEVKTNKVWIDGKPIYRKTYSAGPLPNATNKAIASGLTNINCINIYGYAVRPSDNLHIMLPYSVSSFNVGMLYNNANNILVITQADMTAYTESYITIEYTKTTD